MQPVPMSGQTGEPQVATWSTADAIMSQTYGDELAKDEWSEELSGGEEDDADIADWDEWNTPRYDVERFYQHEAYTSVNDSILHVRACENRFDGAEADKTRYLEDVPGAYERQLRTFIRSTLIEISAISTGAGAAVQTGQVRGVVTPIGGGPKHPRKSDTRARGTKKRNKKRLKTGAEAFGGGDFVD